MVDPNTVFVPLFSTNIKRLRSARINTTFPAANFYLPELDEWLEPDTEHVEQMRIRHGMYELYPEEVYSVHPQYEKEALAASLKVQFKMLSHLITVFPETFRLLENTVENLQTGVQFDLTDNTPPLVRLGLLIQDDITINLLCSDGVHRFVAGFVANPTLWSVRSFLGKSMDEIHQTRVVHYENKLKKAVDATLGRPSVGRLMGRNNWFVYTESIYPLPTFHLPKEKEPVDFTLQNVGESTYLRSELESIFCVEGDKTIAPTAGKLPSVLPEAPVNIFTFRPRVWKMSDVKEHAPENAAKLAEGIQNPDSGYLKETWNRVLVEYLSK